MSKIFQIWQDDLQIFVTSAHSIYIRKVKFMFSKKATKIGKIFTGHLTVTTYCKNDGEDFVNFFGFLRKRELLGLSAWFRLCWSGLNLCMGHLGRAHNSVSTQTRPASKESNVLIASILIYCFTKPLLLFWCLRAWQNWLSSAAWTQKFVCALSSKGHTLYLSFLGPNNPCLFSPKFGSCLLIGGVSVARYRTKAKE